MWKSYVDKLETIKYLTTTEYCDLFIELFKNQGLTHISNEELKNIINKPCDDLFPERLNLENLLHNGETSFLISIFNNYFEFDWNNIFLDEVAFKCSENKELNYIHLFKDLLNSTFFKNIMFDTEKLLSNDCNTLSFLFLYFLPCVDKKSLTFNYQKKRPLLSCNKITKNHFDMLFYLMKKYNTEEFKLLCKNHNLNHNLVDDFMDSAQNLYGFEKNVNWDLVLPLERIKILLKEGCTFKDFSFYRDQKTIAIFPLISNKLLEIESRVFYEKLQNQLFIKSSVKIEKEVKI